MAVLPLKDFNPLVRIRFQYVTVAIIAVCVAAFLWQQSLDPEAGSRAVYGFGMIPAVLLESRQLSPDLVVIPAAATVVTSMFLHGGWLHLIGNMLYLWIFGDNVEDSMGHGRFVAFYLLSGIAATLTHVATNPASTVPTIGASGAIAGVLGAYLVLHPRTKVLVLLLFRIPLYLPAYIVLGGWIVLQLVMGFMTPPTEGGVAWFAHIGGFIAGAALIPIFRHKRLPLLDRPGPWGGRR